MEEKFLDIDLLKTYIKNSFKKKKSLKIYLQENFDEIVSEVINVDEEFFDIVEGSFSNDDEMYFIKSKTGYSIELIEKILWERYCFEMKEGLWEYDADVCLKCKNEYLLFREVPDVEYGEKIVCQKCGYEMIIGPESLKPFNQNK